MSFGKSKKLNIAILASGQTFLTRSLIEKLAEEGHMGTLMHLKTGMFSTYKEPINAIVVFVDSAIMEDMSAMVYLRDYSVENDAFVFFIGAPADISAVEKHFPQSQIKGTFMRPIDINEVLKAILQYLLFAKKGDRKSILVVDDCGTYLRMVKGMFDNKYHVMLASSAAMAFKSMALHQPDLILLDYEMPIVDGKQVFEMIRSEADFSDIPIIFLTSVNDADTIKDLMVLRPAGYLLKNMPASDIIKAVDGFFAIDRYKSV